MDRQIFRVIGKATTLAAYVLSTTHIVLVELNWLRGYRMAYRIRQGREFVTPPAGLSYTGLCVAPMFGFPAVLDFAATGSCTKWTTLVRKTTSHHLYSRKRLTCCSFCMLTTNSTQAVRRCSKLAARSWTHILRLRQWLSWFSWRHVGG